MIIGGSASQDLASHVAKELGEEICYVETKKFPDGERYLRIDGQIEDEVTVIQSTGYPQDENLMELMFIVSTLKDLGAKKVKVVVPYLGYARQEKRFKDGESVSAKIICNLIEAAGADEFPQHPRYPPHPHHPHRRLPGGPGIPGQGPPELGAAGVRL